MTAPLPTPLIDIYKSLVKTRKNHRPPRTNVERAAYAHTVARRLLIENHAEEFRRLYEGVLSEIPPIDPEAQRAHNRALTAARKAAYSLSSGEPVSA